MSNRYIFVLVILVLLHVFSFTVFAQDHIPDLKGKWSGSSFLTADGKGIHHSNNRIVFVVLQQSGLAFSGNIELQVNDVIKMRNFSGSLNERKGYMWYFSIVTEEGTLNIGYLVTKNVMKVNLRTFQPRMEIAVCRLTRGAPIGE